MAAKKNAKVHAKPKTEGAKSSSANRNGRKGESGFFTWFMVLALLGVWTSVAVVYFDLVDYQGVLDKAKGIHINLSDALQGKLVAYDTDGDGDFDVEDAKVLLDEPGGSARRAAKDPHPTKDVGLKLRQALMQQLEVIHQRVEAKKLARLALAEVRQLLAKEEEEQELDVGRKEISARVKERVAARLRAEEEKMEQEEMEKLRKEKAKEEEEKLKKEEEKLREEEKEEVEVEEEEGREPKPKRKKSKPERKDRI